MEAHLDKTTLRKLMRAKRLALTPEFCYQASITAVNHFVHHRLFALSQHIGCYLAVNQEFNTSPLINAIWQAGKACYAPVITHQQLAFIRYTATTPLVLNQYQIPEPLKLYTTPPVLDITFLPLLAFDKQGHRLGYGSGYYDKTYARLEMHHKPLLIGLGYAEQEVTELPFDPWDVRLDGALTEQGLTLFNRMPSHDLER